MKKLLGIAAVACLVSLYAVSAMGAAAPDGKMIFSSICANCHGATGTGGKAPALKGQSAADLERKLEGYKAGTYGGNRKNVMENMVKQRTPEELKAVREYIGTL